MAQVAWRLDSEYSVMTRVGLHCAPNAHKTLDTYPAGTIRFSFGPENTEEELDTAIDGLKENSGYLILGKDCGDLFALITAMEFKQLEAFVAVVENKSFSEAARQLNLTQPTISAHIQSLEQELNSRLLIRTTKKLTITQRGLQLYDCASNILNMRSNIIEEFTGINKKIVDLAVSTIPSSYLLPEILSAFTCQIPDVYFHSWQSDSLGGRVQGAGRKRGFGTCGNTFEDQTAASFLFERTNW